MADRLKDIFFTEQTLGFLADNILKHHSSFDKKVFFALVFDKTWDELELKARMRHVSRALHATLPEDYRQAVDILRKVAPQITGFDAMVLSDFIEVYGLEDWDCSLPALGYLTRYGSAEFAIRPFLLQDQKRVMKLMLEWADDKHENVRRFASEGCRPRLPWAMAVPELKRDPAPILPVLEKLKKDPSESVRRSVANNLNDISKDHPQLVLDICQTWFGDNQETDRIVKHALRGLLKAGNRRALMLFGFADPRNLTIANLSLPDEVQIGSEFTFSFDLINNSNKATKIRIEYSLNYLKATGKKSRTIFQITESTIEPGKRTFAKKQSFTDMSTRKHHPGRHMITVICNGKEMITREFIVTD